MAKAEMVASFDASLDPKRKGAKMFACIVCCANTKLRCSKCYRVAYCSICCQRKHWKMEHKDRCRDETEYEFHERVTPDLTLKVEVRESPVHGKGVFATQDIHSGEYICFFAGEQKELKIRIRIKVHEDGRTMEICNANEAFLNMYQTTEYVDNSMSHPDGQRREIRIASPEQDGFGVGQFLNDACKPLIEQCDTFPQAAKLAREYEDQSLKQANCETNRHFWFKATKDISAGEEIFIHYGFAFWVRKFLLEATSPEKRLLFYSLSDQDANPFDLRKYFMYEENTLSEFLLTLLKIPRADLEKAGKSAEVYLSKMTEKIKMVPDTFLM